MDFIVVNDHPQMLKYVDWLQHKNAEALSFYPTSVFEREISKGRLLLSLLNNEPCGYCYIGATGIDLKIHQICIQYDVRRRLYGAMLVSQVELIGKDCRSITLRCGFDLEANSFWQSLGYNCIAIQDGGVRRMRKINIWRKYLQNALLPPEILTPAEGETDASIWRKRKVDNVVNQFSRGKALVDYRNLVAPSKEC